MGRKNSKVRQANNRGRLARKGQREEFRGIAIPQQPRVRVENLVMPDGHCSKPPRPGRKPKARFATPEKAARALKQAQQQRARVGSGHVEKRYYECPETACGGYHLTSREEYQDRRQS